MKKIIHLFLIVSILVLGCNDIKNENIENQYAKLIYIKQKDTIVNRNLIGIIEVKLGFDFKYFYKITDTNYIITDMIDTIELANFYQKINDSTFPNKLNIKSIRCIEKKMLKNDILMLIEFEFIKNKTEIDNYTKKYLLLSKSDGIIGAYCTLDNNLYNSVGTIFTLKNIQ